MNKYVRSAESFLDKCVFNGLAHSLDVVTNKFVKPYPEVTGYYIKYFCDNYSVNEKIKETGNYLLSIQDTFFGGWSSFYDTDFLYTFDTAQILIGLCSLYMQTKDNKYLDAILKAEKFLNMMQLSNGAFIPIYDRKRREKIIDKNVYYIWNGPFSGLMCKLTEAYDSLFDVTGEKEYLETKNKIADFYSNSKYIEHTHPLGYWLEGLYCAKRFELVQDILDTYVIPRIEANGYISYQEKLPYAYVSGVIQLGIILYKMGYISLAVSIREYGRQVQNKHSSGGLFQYAKSNGDLDTHIHTEINLWGTKYFCELERLL